jgi:hypothetical protein
MNKNFNQLQRLMFYVVITTCFFLNIAAVRAQYSISPITGACLTHVQGGTSPSYTFTAAGSHVQGTPVWSVRGDLEIVSQTQSPLAVTVRSTGYGKGRIRLTYNQGPGCGAGETVSVDVFKTFAPPDPIIGPTCVRPGEVVTFSVKPIVSGAAQISSEIDVDNYTWTINGTVVDQSTWWSSGAYKSGDGSSVTLVAPADIGASPVLSVVVGRCNTATPVSLSLTTKANVPVFSGTVPSCIPANSTAPFNLSVVNEPGVTYTWSGPTGWLISAPVIANGLNTVSITPDRHAGEVTVVAKATNASCESAVNKVFITRQLVAPFNTISGGTGCLVVGTAYTFTLQNAPAGTSYEWTAPTGWTPSTFTGGSTATFTPTASAQPGSVTVKNVVCTAGVISVTPVVANNQGLNFNITDLDCGLFRVSAPGFVRAGSTYQWFLDGVLQGTSSGVDNTFTFNQWTGTRTVSVRITKASPDCLDATATLPNKTYACSGLLAANTTASTALSNAVTVYPNPASNKVTVTLPEGDAVKQVLLEDQYGRVQKRFNTVQNTYTIDISALPPGLYVITVKTGKETVAKKMKLER